MTQTPMDRTSQQRAEQGAACPDGPGAETTGRQGLDRVADADGAVARSASTRVLELKVPPPIVALVLALLMGLTPAATGLVEIPYPARAIFAVVLVVVGQSIGIAGMIALRRARTTLHPVKASLASSLVVGGVYRYTRNPMYVGLLLTLLAWALFLANPFAALWAVVYVLYITRFQIIPEERLLASLFGAEYRAYRGEVRRWWGSRSRSASPQPDEQLR